MNTIERVQKEVERANTIALLRDMLPPSASMVYTVLMHVTPSGMSRDIKCLISQNGTIRDITALVAEAINKPLTKNRFAIRMRGAGMDMAFHLVYSLSRTLYGQGYTCTGENCRSNDHANGNNDRTPHLHEDGGYAINHEWL